MTEVVCGSATYLDGKTPLKRSARVTISSTHIEFQADYGEGDPQSELLHRRAISMVKIERVRHDLYHVHLSYENGERLEISSPDLIAKIQLSSSIWDIDITRHVKKKIAIALALMMILTVSLWLGIPHVAKIIAHMIPVEQEAKLAEYVIPQFKREICNDEKAHRILQRLAERLLMAGKINHPVKVFYGATLTLNAFAIPGNVIIVYPGLISRMNSPEVLAGVMAHEIQHHVQRHITAHIVRATMMTAIWQAALGDFSGILVLDPSTVIQIATLKYSRDAEREADTKGAQLLEQAGIAVVPMLDFLDELDRLMGGDKIPEFLVTHPLKGRGERLRAQYGNVKTTQEVMSQDDWNYLNAGCIRRSE